MLARSGVASLIYERIQKSPQAKSWPKLNQTGCSSKSQKEPQWVLVVALQGRESFGALGRLERRLERKIFSGGGLLLWRGLLRNREQRWYGHESELVKCHHFGSISLSTFGFLSVNLGTFESIYSNLAHVCIFLMNPGTVLSKSDENWSGTYLPEPSSRAVMVVMHPAIDPSRRKNTAGGYTKQGFLDCVEERDHEMGTRFGQNQTSSKCRVLFRDFPLIVNCLGW